MDEKQIALDYLNTIDTSLFESNSIQESWGHQCLVLESPTIKLVFEVDVDARGRIFICGSTSFFVNGSWYTFDRHGISHSFYSPMDWNISTWDTDTVILEQIERAENAIARHEKKGKTIKVFPGINLFAEDLAKKVEQFNKTGQVFFTPAGMGIGYKLSKVRSSRFDNPISERVKLLTGIQSAWVQQIDCD